MRSEWSSKVSAPIVAGLVGCPPGLAPAAQFGTPPRPGTPGSDSSGSGSGGATDNAGVSKLVVQQLAKTKMCAMYARGVCDDAMCCFAHTREELRKAPDLTKTAICRAFQRGMCRETDCKFAHGEQELRNSPNVYKTQICHFFERGHCKKGNRCRHAHGPAELRAFEERVTTLESSPLTPLEQRSSTTPGRAPAAPPRPMQPPSMGPMAAATMGSVAASAAPPAVPPGATLGKATPARRSRGSTGQRPPSHLVPPLSVSAELDTQRPETPPRAKTFQADRLARQASPWKTQQAAPAPPGPTMPEPMKVKLPNLLDCLRTDDSDATFVSLGGPLAAPAAAAPTAADPRGSVPAAAEAAWRRQEQARVAYAAMAAKFAELVSQPPSHEPAAASAAAMLAALAAASSSSSGPAGALDPAAVDAIVPPDVTPAPAAAAPTPFGFASWDEYGYLEHEAQAWAAAAAVLQHSLPPPSSLLRGNSRQGTPSTPRELQNYVDGWHPAIGSRTVPPSSWVA